MHFSVVESAGAERYDWHKPRGSCVSGDAGINGLGAGLLVPQIRLCH